jgi:hypothetical protein
VAGKASCTRCSVRLADTTTASSAVAWAWQAKGSEMPQATAQASAAGRTWKKDVFMMKQQKKMPAPASPPGHKRFESTRTQAHLVGRYPGWRRCFHRLPKRLFKALSGE